MKKTLLYSGLILASGLGLVLSGCGSGDTDGGTAQIDQEGGVFVSGDGTTGSIHITPKNETPAVGEVVGFFVEVRDASGNPVPHINVSCDTEQGLALIEPVKGFELTSESGDVSGKFGCEVPGSLQLVCRLPVGANLRAFADIKCSGEVPLGFTGFPGAGGGGLGGGVQTIDNGGVGGGNTSGLRVQTLTFSDEGGDTATTSIDTLQDADCTPDDAATSPAEPFFDSSVKINIENNTKQAVRFYKVKYSLSNADGAGSSFTSKDLGVVAEADANGGTAEFSVLVFNANGGRKRFADSSFNIPISLGFRSIKVTVYGTNSLGEQVSISGSATVSFGDFSRCTS